MKTKVLIADDHPLVRSGIRRALEAEQDIEVVGEATNGAKVLPLIGQTGPDLVVLDLSMPQLDGFACLDQIRKRHPDVKVVILSATGDPDRVRAALSRGATAYVVKSVDVRDLAAALRQAVEGTVFHAVGVPQESDQGLAESAGLTKRELAVLKAVARGLSNQAIGREFWVSEQTVKFHLRNIFRKLGVGSRTEAARYAFEHGLVESSV
jgi:two-component system, NarL family, nitrate/nitrite response regulator NarL